MGDRHTLATTKSRFERLRAMTMQRAEVIRAIAADAMFSEDPERSVGFVRAVILDRVRQVLGADCTCKQLFQACCDDMPKGPNGGQ